MSYSITSDWQWAWTSVCVSIEWADSVWLSHETNEVVQELSIVVMSGWVWLGCGNWDADSKVHHVQPSNVPNKLVVAGMRNGAVVHIVHRMIILIIIRTIKTMNDFVGDRSVETNQWNQVIIPLNARNHNLWGPIRLSSQFFRNGNADA